MRSEINLHQGDCMDAMAKMPDNAYDLAIVDPPYGIGDFSMTSNIKGKKGVSKKSGTYDWNNAPPENNYFLEVQRVSKNQIIWGANYYNCFGSNGGAIVWYKNMGHKDLSQCEIASVSIGKRVAYTHINWQSGFIRSQSGGNWHPCEKPVKLYEWLLTNYAKEGDKILDTHGGSMSIALACHNLKFDLDLWELDEDYYKAGVKRFEQHKNQLQLF